MKISLISGVFFPQPGGAQVQTHNFANKLVELGHDVDCYIFRKTNIKNNNYNILIINKFISSLVYFFKYYLNLNINFFLKFYLKIIIKEKKYDIWHFNFLNFKSLILINCLKDLDQKVIVTFQGLDIQIDKNINYGYRLNKKYNSYFLSTIKKVDLFAAISNNIKDDLLKLDVDAKKIVQVPNCVELEKFKSNNYDFDEKEIFKLITVARFAEKKKGFDILEDLTLKLLKKNLKFRWTIIGDKTSLLFKNEKILQNKKFFNIIDNIENIDEMYFPHSSLINYYLKSDLYINLARIESFGITFIESLSAKTPIITFNTKGANEIIIDNYNGYIIENTNLDKFADKIEYLFKNKNKLEELKKNTLESVKNYDLNLIVKKLLEIYRKF